MDLMERFLDGEVSVICHSREEIEKLLALFEPDSLDYCVILGALRNNDCISGAEFAYRDRYVPGDRYVHYNPIDHPMYEFDHFTYTETLDFPEFWDGLNYTFQVPDFDSESFYTMLGIGGG